MLGWQVAEGNNMGGICDTWIGNFGKSYANRMNGRQKLILK